jgi:hypothetical protein
METSRDHPHRLQLTVKETLAMGLNEGKEGGL